MENDRERISDVFDNLIGEEFQKTNGLLIRYVSFKYFGAFTLVDMFKQCNSFFG